MNYLAGVVSAFFCAVALTTMCTAGVAVQLAAGLCPLIALAFVLCVRVIGRPPRLEAYLCLDYTVALPALAMFVKYLAIGNQHVTFAALPIWHAYAWLAFSLAFTASFMAIDQPARRTAGGFVLMMLAGFLCFHGMYLVSDIAFDRSLPATQRFLITDKTLVTSGGRAGGREHLLSVNPPMDGSPRKTIDAAFWQRSHIGDGLCIYTHAGALNRPWRQLALCT